MNVQDLPHLHDPASAQWHDDTWITSWGELVANARATVLTAADRAALVVQKNEGEQAERQLVSFHDYLVTATHPPPTPNDAERDQRDVVSAWNYATDGPHPCGVNRQQLFSHAVDHNDPSLLNNNYRACLDASMRHVCAPNYCRKRDPQTCKFHFPHKVRAHSAVVVTEQKTRSGAFRRASVNVYPARNDRWLNTHCRALMEAWGANIDFEFVVDR
jgi:hypothetical protein